LAKLINKVSDILAHRSAVQICVGAEFLLLLYCHSHKFSLDPFELNASDVSIFFASKA